MFAWVASVCCSNAFMGIWTFTQGMKSGLSVNRFAIVSFLENSQHFQKMEVVIKLLNLQHQNYEASKRMKLEKC